MEVSLGGGAAIPGKAYLELAAGTLAERASHA